MKPYIERSLYFALQWLRGEPVRAVLSDVRRTEFLPVAALRKLQAERQVAQLRFAIEHVPYYRQAYRPFTDQLARVGEWEEVAALLRQLPVVEKGAVIGHGAEFTAENIGILKTYTDRTSGSTGTPLSFPCDQRAWAYRHALLFRMLESFGIQVGEPYALFFGLHWNSRTRMKVALRDRILNRVRISAYEIESKKLDNHLQIIQRHRPTYFLGYPSAIHDFCMLLRERGIDLSHLGLKAVILTGEPLRPDQRTLIDKVTCSRCANLYGSAEGGTTAFECPSGSLHVAAEAVWVDTSGGASEPGGGLVTDLMLRAFPLIRYSIGDEIVPSREVCKCGRAHPVLQSVEGRSGQPIVLPNGRRVNANLPSYIFKPLAPLEVVRRYRFVHSPKGLELQVVVTERFKPEHVQLIEKEVHSAFGDDVGVNIRLVDALPYLPNAKHRDYVKTTVPDT